jgi:hypothetical protein
VDLILLTAESAGADYTPGAPTFGAEHTALQVSKVSWISPARALVVPRFRPALHGQIPALLEAATIEFGRSNKHQNSKGCSPAGPRRHKALGGDLRKLQCLIGLETPQRPNEGTCKRRRGMMSFAGREFSRDSQPAAATQHFRLREF